MSRRKGLKSGRCKKEPRGTALSPPPPGHGAAKSSGLGDAWSWERRDRRCSLFTSPLISDKEMFPVSSGDRFQVWGLRFLLIRTGSCLWSQNVVCGDRCLFLAPHPVLEGRHNSTSGDRFPFAITGFVSRGGAALPCLHAPPRSAVSHRCSSLLSVTSLRLRLRQRGALASPWSGPAASCSERGPSTTAAPRTEQADLSSKIQYFHTMAKGNQQPNSPQEKAVLFSPEDENQQSKRGCKWNVDRRKSHRLLCVGLCAVPCILVTVLLVVLIVLQYPSCSPRPHFSHVCPNAWVGFQGKCYYFSDTESDWNSSREHCQRLGASLATVDNEDEMEFMLRNRGPANCWIGLHREEGDERWTWADGSAFTNWFQLRGGGRCAYLNGNRISSALCHTEKYWVCSRADSYVLWREETYPQ